MSEKILLTGADLQVGDLIKEGERLIDELEKRGFSISAAFWRYPDERGLPRLVIVSPKVGRDGPRSTYLSVIEAIDALGEKVHFGLSDVSVMSPSWSQFQELRTAVENSGVDPSDRDMDLGDYHVFRWNPAA